MIYAENIFICIAVPLAMVLLFVKAGAKRFITAFLIGMATCLMSAYIGGFLAVVSGMGMEDTSVFISPVVEEIMKLSPIILYLMLADPTDDDLLVAAAGCGAGFATFENCCHILSTGAQDLFYIIIRGAAVGVMHLVTMVVLVMGIYLLRRYKAFSFAGVMGVLSLAMTFHGLYNLLVSEPGASSYVGYTLPLICAFLLYVLYRTGMFDTGVRRSQEQ